MKSAPSSSSSVPSAAIFSPMIPTSPTNVPPGVTTVPPAMTRSKRMLASPCLCQRVVQCVEREVDVGGGDAHGRLDAEHVAVEPSLPDQRARLAHRLQHVERLLLRRLLGR